MTRAQPGLSVCSNLEIAGDNCGERGSLFWACVLSTFPTLWTPSSSLLPTLNTTIRHPETHLPSLPPLPFFFFSFLLKNHKAGICFTASNLEASSWLVDGHSHDVLNMDRSGEVVKRHSFQSWQWLGFMGLSRGITDQHPSKHRAMAKDTECLTEESG